MIDEVPRSGPVRRVLVVDDDPDNRLALVELLGDEGFEANGVGDGRQALSWLRQPGTQTSLVLLDLMMPVMDGDAFLSAKEHDPAIAGLPVVLMTASGPGACERIARRHQVLSFVHKPIAVAALLSVLTSFFTREDKRA